MRCAHNGPQRLCPNPNNHRAVDSLNKVERPSIILNAGADLGRTKTGGRTAGKNTSRWNASNDRYLNPELAVQAKCAVAHGAFRVLVGQAGELAMANCADLTGARFAPARFKPIFASAACPTAFVLGLAPQRETRVQVIR